MLAMLMMRPQPFCFIAGSAARMVWNDALRLIAMMASHLSGGKFSTRATCWMPALFTRMSMPPSLAWRVGHEVGDLAGLAHVGGVIRDLDAALRFHLVAQPIDGGGLAKPVQHDAAALGREGLGYGESDSAGRPGDQRRLTLKRHRDSTS